MVNATKMYICSKCDKAHKEIQDALDCCPTEVIEQFECESCGTLFDTVDEANDCCGEDELE